VNTRTTKPEALAGLWISPQRESETYVRSRSRSIPRKLQSHYNLCVEERCAGFRIRKNLKNEGWFDKVGEKRGRPGGAQLEPTLRNECANP
jgi:hypothetical protein